MPRFHIFFTVWIRLYWVLICLITDLQLQFIKAFITWFVVLSLYVPAWQILCRNPFFTNHWMNLLPSLLFSFHKNLSKCCSLRLFIYLRIELPLYILFLKIVIHGGVEEIIERWIWLLTKTIILFPTFITLTLTLDLIRTYQIPVEL